ncbi:DUF3240 family protein [Glaciecola sp. 1036]|uniref:DUF3240 family protein n=1 Tax=Alteromonadaceae TaxID=72275 RepID=UPI003CFDAE50
MNQNHSSILTLFFSKNLYDDLVDCLMSNEDIAGFTINQVQGFSRQHAQYDVAEQVAGYRNLYSVDILISNEQLEKTLNAFSEIGSDHPLRYWVTPVTESGVIEAKP